MNPKEAGRSSSFGEERSRIRNPYLAVANNYFGAVAEKNHHLVRSSQTANIDFLTAVGEPCTAQFIRDRNFVRNDWQTFEISIVQSNTPGQGKKSITCIFLDTDETVKRYSGPIPFDAYRFLMTAPVAESDNSTFEDIILDWSTQNPQIQESRIDILSNSEVLSQIYEINSGMEKPLIPFEELPLRRTSYDQQPDTIALYKQFFEAIKTYSQITSMKLAKGNALYTLIQLTDSIARPLSIKFSKQEHYIMEEGLRKMTVEEWLFLNKLGANSYVRRDSVSAPYGTDLTEEKLKQIRASHKRSAERDTEITVDPELKVREIWRGLSLMEELAAA